MKTFYLVRSMQVTYFMVFLFALAGVVFLGYTAFEAIRSASTDVLRPWGLFPLAILTMGFIPLLLAAWAGLYMVAVHRGRLVFEEQALVFESIKRFTGLLPLWLRPVRLPYNRIREVRLGKFASLVEITDLQGRKTTLAPSWFGRNYGEEVLIELKNHLPAEKFLLGMEIPEIRRKMSRLNNVGTATGVLVLVAFLAMLFLDPDVSSRPWLIHGWQVQRRVDAWVYSRDSQENFWIVSLDLSYSHIYHFSEKLDQEWKLPESLLGKQFPNQVSGDRNGNPIVWLEDGVYHYEAAGWKKIPFARALKLWDRLGISVVSGEQGWTIGKQGADTVLLKIEALTGQWSELPLPESAVAQGLSPLSLRRAVNGDLLVRMSGANGNRVYRLSDDRWKPQEYSLPASQSDAIQDYFLDEQDALWVLIKTGTYQVAKIEATGKLHLTQLPPPQQLPHPWENNDPVSYNFLLVDSFGRVWVNGGFHRLVPNFMAVFTPVWDGKATELVHYTYENSNYQGSQFNPPVMSPDGKIWSFDRSVTTMDTRVESLPAPLPAWFVAIDWNHVWLGVAILQSLLMVLLYLYSFRSTRIGKQGIRGTRV